MKFETLAAFIDMGGHGPYVWAAYGVTLLVLAANLWWPRRARISFIRSEKRQAASHGEQA